METRPQKLASLELFVYLIAKMKPENEETAMDEDDAKAKKNVKAIEVSPFILPCQDPSQEAFISPIGHEPVAAKEFRESMMSGHFPYDPGTCDDAKVEDYYQSPPKLDPQYTTDRHAKHLSRLVRMVFGP